MLLEDAWGSITVLCNELIIQAQGWYPGVPIQFVDWEAHSNIAELPNADLIGPTAVSVMEHSADLVEINFAIGVSTYASDQNLFRLRKLVGAAFERVRAEKKMAFYDAGSAVEKSVVVFTDGTTIVPMTRAEPRPWQYVQTSGLLVPS